MLGADDQGGGHSARSEWPHNVLKYR